VDLGIVGDQELLVALARHGHDVLPDELSAVLFWHAVISSPAVIAAVVTTALRRWRFFTGGSFRVGVEQVCAD
jgi:hypothetical protein